MTDRSDETTVSKPDSTDDLLAETERLLDETGADDAEPRAADEGAESRPASFASDEFDLAADETASESTDRSGSRRIGVRRFVPSIGFPSRFSPRTYFSPKAFLALSAMFGVGYFGGGLTIPVAGSLLGLFAVAFAVGLASSKRRYLEVGAAGCTVGAVMSALNYVVVIAAGIGSRLIFIGLMAGLGASLFGYYLGRDLRDGVTRTE
ncbi:hypothetical protein [Halovivax gelatinilyticus]|uniref:hypothetical protein n=1 Tax=Halovivax gelatinilyticus TaxID=2961597 RepID=UPI0020CA4961|nr:hypothetical protein [Halovivax gelatinilyticus]